MDKICSTCKLPKSTSDFYSLHSSKDLLTPDCKECSKRKTILRTAKKRQSRIDNRIILPGEIYKVSSICSHYEISNFGNLWSIRNANNIKGALSGKGYLVVKLYLTKDLKFSTGIHRLVATEFIPNPDNLPEVHHENYIKTCNFDWNLKWVTTQQNIQDAYDKGEKTNAADKHPKTYFTNDQVLGFRNLYDNGMPVKQIATAIGHKYDTIWKLVKRINYSTI